MTSAAGRKTHSAAIEAFRAKNALVDGSAARLVRTPMDLERHRPADPDHRGEKCRKSRNAYEVTART